MAQSLIAILIFLLPVAGLLSGFSVAITTPLLLITILISFKKQLSCQNIKNNLLANYKLELLFCLWCLITNFYSLSYPASLFIYLQICPIILMWFIVNSNISKLNIDIRKTQRYFLIGIAVTIILFAIEYLSHGALVRTFRTIFQPNSSGEFFLFILDRGCSLLSMLSWIVIAILLRYHKYVLALIYYELILYLLYISDSLASFLAFTISGLVFLISKLLSSKTLQTIFFKLFTITLISGSILMPIIFYKIPSLPNFNRYIEFLPDSAKHRAFIWHFVATKIIDKPIFGYGFSASKNAKINENDMIHYKDQVWHPLPLHPHNIILQILFETGLVGLLLFLSMLYKYSKMISNISSTTHLTIKTNNNITELSLLNYKSIAYACLINYYIIAMISYNIWQTWWVCSIFTVSILFKLFVRLN